MIHSLSLKEDLPKYLDGPFKNPSQKISSMYRINTNQGYLAKRVGLEPISAKLHKNNCQSQMTIIDQGLILPKNIVSPSPTPLRNRKNSFSESQDFGAAFSKSNFSHTKRIPLKQTTKTD